MSGDGYIKFPGFALAIRRAAHKLKFPHAVRRVNTTFTFASLRNQPDILRKFGNRREIITHRAVEAHRGVVLVDSGPTGTRFHILLPLEPDAVASGPSTTPS